MIDYTKYPGLLFYYSLSFKCGVIDTRENILLATLIIGRLYSKQAHN